MQLCLRKAEEREIDRERERAAVCFAKNLETERRNLRRWFLLQTFTQREIEPTCTLYLINGCCMHCILFERWRRGTPNGKVPFIQVDSQGLLKMSRRKMITFVDYIEPCLI